jgi:tetratricopeptide (TPR) repeat protein
MPEARLGFASFLWAVGRLDEGADVLKRAADDDPGHAFLGRALGLFYLSRGRDAEAEKYLKVAASTNDRDSQLVLADYYLQRNRDEDALPMLDKMAAGDDPDGGAAMRAADIEFRLGRREQAMQRAEKVLARDPGNARALRIKAQALFAAKDFSQAMTIARAAVAAEPGSREARSVLARSLAATGDPDGAFAEFTEVWRLNSRDAETAKEMAGLALTLGRDQVALEFATIAKQKLPNDPSVSDILGWAYVRKDAPTRGLPHLQDAVRAEPASALFRYHLGIAHYRMREFPRAREELTRALGLDPNFSGAPDAQKVLNRLAK